MVINIDILHTGGQHGGSNHLLNLHGGISLKNFEGKPSGSNFCLPSGDGLLTRLSLTIFFARKVDVLGSDISQRFPGSSSDSLALHWPWNFRDVGDVGKSTC